MPMTVLAELQSALKTKATDPKTLLNAADKVADDVWEAFSKKTRNWINENLTEMTAAEDEKRDPKLSAPEGVDGDEVKKEDEKPPVTAANGAAHPAGDDEKGAAEAEAEDKAKTGDPEPPAEPTASTRRTRTAAAKPEKAATPAKDKKYTRVPMWPDSQITVVETKNPYEEGSKSATHYEGYVNNMTLAQALKQGIPRPQILADRQKGRITMTAGTPPKKKAKGAGKTKVKATAASNRRKPAAQKPATSPATARKSNVVGDILNACSNLTSSQLDAVTKGLAELQETDESLRKIAAKLPKLTPAVLARLLALQDS